MKKNEKILYSSEILKRRLYLIKGAKRLGLKDFFGEADTDYLYDPREIDKDFKSFNRFLFEKGNKTYNRRSLENYEAYDESRLRLIAEWLNFKNYRILIDDNPIIDDYIVEIYQGKIKESEVWEKIEKGENQNKNEQLPNKIKIFSHFESYNESRFFHHLPDVKIRHIVILLILTLFVSIILDVFVKVVAILACMGLAGFFVSMTPPEKRTTIFKVLMFAVFSTSSYLIVKAIDDYYERLEYKLQAQITTPDNTIVASGGSIQSNIGDTLTLNVTATNESTRTHLAEKFIYDVHLEISVPEGIKIQTAKSYVDTTRKAIPPLYRVEHESQTVVELGIVRANAYGNIEMDESVQTQMHVDGQPWSLIRFANILFGTNYQQWSAILQPQGMADRRQGFPVDKGARDISMPLHKPTVEEFGGMLSVSGDDAMWDTGECLFIDADNNRLVNSGDWYASDCGIYKRGEVVDQSDMSTNMAITPVSNVLVYGAENSQWFDAIGKDIRGFPHDVVARSAQYTIPLQITNLIAENQTITVTVHAKDIRGNDLPPQTAQFYVRTPVAPQIQDAYFSPDIIALDDNEETTLFVSVSDPNGLDTIQYVQADLSRMGLRIRDGQRVGDTDVWEFSAINPKYTGIFDSIIVTVTDIDNLKNMALANSLEIVKGNLLSQIHPPNTSNQREKKNYDASMDFVEANKFTIGIEDPSEIIDKMNRVDVETHTLQATNLLPTQIENVSSNKRKVSTVLEQEKPPTAFKKNVFESGEINTPDKKQSHILQRQKSSEEKRSFDSTQSSSLENKTEIDDNPNTRTASHKTILANDDFIEMEKRLLAMIKKEENRLPTKIDVRLNGKKYKTISTGGSFMIPIKVLNIDSELFAENYLYDVRIIVETTENIKLANHESRIFNGDRYFIPPMYASNNDTSSIVQEGMTRANAYGNLDSIEEVRTKRGKQVWSSILPNIDHHRNEGEKVHKIAPDIGTPIHRPTYNDFGNAKLRTTGGEFWEPGECLFIDKDYNKSISISDIHANECREKEYIPIATPQKFKKIGTTVHDETTYRFGEKLYDPKNIFIYGVKDRHWFAGDGFPIDVIRFNPEIYQLNFYVLRDSSKNESIDIKIITHSLDRGKFTEIKKTSKIRRNEVSVLPTGLWGKFYPRTIFNNGLTETLLIIPNTDSTIHEVRVDLGVLGMGNNEKLKFDGNHTWSLPNIRAHLDTGEYNIPVTFIGKEGNSTVNNVGIVVENESNNAIYTHSFMSYSSPIQNSPKRLTNFYIRVYKKNVKNVTLDLRKIGGRSSEELQYLGSDAWGLLRFPMVHHEYSYFHEITVSEENGNKIKELVKLP